ncbi:glutathione S-transferase [Fennellomyces sp. T-0311]|nr:glutathione S-transferase [Fennellomyces sp. T-0311]
MSSAARKVTLYTLPTAVSPFVQRAAIALNEVGLAYETFAIDIYNKPSWYKNVNPETKVPVLTIQGKNIAESLIIIELINDLKPEKGLLPSDPILRAQIRFVIQFYDTKIFSAGNNALSDLSDQGLKRYVDTVTPGYARINELLLEQASSGPYFLGSRYSLADIAIAPFAARQKAIIGAVFPNIHIDIIDKSPRLKEFMEGIVDRPSFKDTYPGDKVIVDDFVEHFITNPK